MRTYEIIEVDIPISVECIIDENENNVVFLLNKNLKEKIKEKIVAHELQILAIKNGYEFDLKWNANTEGTTHTHTHTQDSNDSGCE